uniref:Homing endonuclease LAGLIDADG domain-containing protein n=1 Tax=Naumovozyma castellii TaxID=27288 RepID=A0A2H4NZK6_NAUCA|nr:hypothetical protein [Naumovozyma castellii]
MIPFSKDIKLIRNYTMTNNDMNNNNNLIMNDHYNGNLLEIYPRSNREYIQPDNISKELVIYGSNLETTLNLPDYTNIVKQMVNIPNNILYIMTGVLLTDGWIDYTSKKKLDNKSLMNINGRFMLKQSMIHCEYLIYVYMLLSHYCKSPPKLKIATVKGKNHSQLQFYTRALPCFTTLRHMFYNGRVKIVPKDLYNLLNYESLAHMIMCDGSNKEGGINLNLQSFTLKELIFIMNILYIKFDLNCTLHKSRNSYTIYIRVESVKRLYPKIMKFIIPSMRYKFNTNLAPGPTGAGAPSGVRQYEN